MMIDITSGVVLGILIEYIRGSSLNSSQMNISSNFEMMKKSFVIKVENLTFLSSSFEVRSGGVFFVLHLLLFCGFLFLIVRKARQEYKKINRTLNEHGVQLTHTNSVSSTSIKINTKDEENHLHQHQQHGKLEQVSLREFLLYKIDFHLSTDPYTKPLALFFITYAMIVTGALLYLSNGYSHGFSEAMWVTWTYIVDSGAHSAEETPSARVIGVIISIIGMLIFAVVVGFVVEGVTVALDDLKKGKARVIESGHTLILGWSDKVVPLIKELSIANESQQGGVIVILAEKDKDEMENEISSAFTSETLKGTRIVCRSGSPMVMSELYRVSATLAKSIIILASQNIQPDESDARVVRIVMSLVGIRATGCHYVAEMCDIDNKELVTLVGGDFVEVVVAHDNLGNLMLKCSRCPGLAQILEQILGFEGNEFYLRQWDEWLIGRTFGEVIFRFKDAIVLGVEPADPYDAALQISNSLWLKQSFNGFSSLVANEAMLNYMKYTRPTSENFRLSQKLRSRNVVINPPDDYVFRKGDRVLVLAEDDDSYTLNIDGEPHEDGDDIQKLFPSPNAYEAYMKKGQAKTPQFKLPPEQLCFVGWRRDMDDMIMELDSLVSPGSELTIYNMVPIHIREERLKEGGLNVENLRNITLIHEVGNPVLRKSLERLPFEEYSSVLILADESLETDIQTSDSRSLASLLLIRDIINRRSLLKQIKSPGGGSEKEIRQLSSHSLSEQEELLIPKLENNSPSSSLLGSSNNAGGTRTTLSMKKSPHSSLSPERRNQFRRRRSIINPLEGDITNQGMTVLISEILDSRTKALIGVAKISDYVMSNQIIASTIAMVSEDRSINSVLEEILSAKGNSIYLRPCEEYFEFSGEKTSFWTLIARARERREILIGYKKKDSINAILNPIDKDELIPLNVGDFLVVFAQDV